MLRLALRRCALAAVVLAVVLAPATVLAQQPGDETPPDSAWFHTDDSGELQVDFYFVWSESCSHCREARPFIEALPDQYPWLTLHSLPNNTADNVDEAVRLAASIGEEIQSVPAFLICERLYVGYDSAEVMGAFLVERANACLATLAAPDSSIDTPQAASCDATSESIPDAACEAPTTDESGDAEQPLTLPVVGDVDAQAVSLPTFTIVVAALDAFNPCAFFVLLFLLSLLVHARSRLRMLVIGGTFVVISGLAYFVFMAAWLNVFRFSGELRVITTVAGLVAVAFAVVNVKDYFLWGRGPSLSIPDQVKPGLFRRMRGLTAGTAYPALLVGTVTLAIAANSYELLCTAGFPMVYTRVLTLNDLPTSSYYLYLGLYNLVYIVPLLAIVGVFVWRLGSRKLRESEGRVLKLASGLMMLGLGSMLVFSPAVLSNLLAAVAILCGAVIATAVIVTGDRWVRRKAPAP